MTKGKNIFHKEQPAVDSSKPDRFLHVAIRASLFMVDAVTRAAGMAHGRRSARADPAAGHHGMWARSIGMGGVTIQSDELCATGMCGCQSCRRGALLYPDGLRRAFPGSAAESQGAMHVLGNRAACAWAQLHNMLLTRYILIRKPKLDSLCIFLISLVLHMRDFTVGS